MCIRDSSSAYGFISYIMKNVQVPDGMTRLLLADIRGDAPTGTFLLNLNGQMIGWVTDDYERDQLTNLTTAMAISDYKTILEKLSNGIAAPYLGVRGQEVSTAMEENGMPAGVYVAEDVYKRQVEDWSCTIPGTWFLYSDLTGRQYRPSRMVMTASCR